jgi:hypothetical protein
MKCRVISKRYQAKCASSWLVEAGSAFFATGNPMGGF